MDFLNESFLLTNETARRLFFDNAAKMPIVDYHCHIAAGDILSDKRFRNLSEAWLGGDHYKWRLMRACGVGEKHITGDAPDFDKFRAFAEILPLCAGNPVYHWSHLELQRFFNINEPLSSKTAADIWEKTSLMLQDEDSLGARGIPKLMNVEVIVTTDDPIDDLEQHGDLAGEQDVLYRVLPCFRPDAVMDIESEHFPEYIAKLGKSISNFEDLKRALLRRMEYFDDFGCKAADHGLLSISHSPDTDKAVSDVLKKALRGDNVSHYEAEKYRYALLSFLAGEYTRLGWVMELHLGVLRNINSAGFGKCGVNSGFDCIGMPIEISKLAPVLNALNEEGELPKTLIFSINPNDNAAINTLAGCFGKNGVRGLVQQGAAWWFNDSYGGIRRQLEGFAEYGVLGNFVGMLTDSRSMLSYPRHEYFRRILCDYIGGMAERGQYPDDMDFLGKLVDDICYNNVKNYFGV